VSGTASYYEAQTNSLAAISAVNNNFNFAFRIVAEFESTATGGGTANYVTTYGTNSYSTSGTARFDLMTITGTPIPGANTPPTISLTVTDTSARSNSISFAVTVLPLNTAPVISSIPLTNTLLNTSTPAIDFTVDDLETPAGSLNISGSSANPGLVPNGNIVFG